MDIGDQDNGTDRAPLGVDLPPRRTHLLCHMLVVVVDAEEEPKQARDQKSNDPSALGELGHKKDDGYHSSHRGTHTVQCQLEDPVPVMVQDAALGCNAVGWS